MNDDPQGYITPEEFLEGLQRIDETASPLIAEFSALLMGLEARLDDPEAHDCPVDHQVHESLVQAKYRLAETLMWLRSAVATKIAAESGMLEELESFYHPDGSDEDQKPN